MKELKVYALVLAMVGVSGCASTSDIPDAGWLVQTVGDMFVGRSVTDMAATYGVPHAQQDFEGKKIYSWHANTNMQWRRPVTSTTVGTIGDETRYPWARNVPYQQTTTTDQYISTSYRCRLDAYVSQDGIVRNIAFDGKMGACKEFNPYR